MVSFTLGSSPLVRRVLLVTGLGFFAAACQTPPPVEVNATFVATPEFSTRSPSQIAVLPIEDGTPDAAAHRHLVFIRQELMRQLPDRLFTPLKPEAVDSALAAAPKPAAGESILVPAVLQKLAGHAGEDAVLAVRIDRWDESGLPVNNKLWFQFHAALVGSDGVQLWSGSIQGVVKAGGLEAAPRDRDGKARSCATLAITEMVQKLPRRTT